MQSEKTLPIPKPNPTYNGPQAQNSDLYIIAAHPNWRESRVNKLLRDAASGLERADVCDLYSSYPDWHIDIAAEQKRLETARLVVLLHPIHWYSMPALMKLWLDEVLTFGWAYGGGTALQGKDLWLVVSTGGAEDTYHPSGYNRYFFDAFLPPWEQTAALCGMRFLPPLVRHGAHRTSEAEVLQHVDMFRQRLQSYPAWPELTDMEQSKGCAVPGDERPALPIPGMKGAR